MKGAFMGSRSLLTKLCAVFPLLSWTAVLFHTQPLAIGVAVIFSIVIHEAGHYAAFFLLNEPRPRMCFRALGLCLVPRSMLSYRDEIIVCLCGPVANLLSSLCFLVCPPPYFSATFCIQVGFLFGCIHLMPLFPLDGGRIAHALCCLLFGFRRGTHIASVLSLALLFSAAFAALYFMLFYGTAAALFFSCVFLFWEQSSLSDAVQ